MDAPPETPLLRWIMLFDSIHHVLTAERVFRQHGIWHDLVPVPRDLSSDCGMALEFRAADAEAVRAMLAEVAIGPRRVYRTGPEGREEVRDER